MPWPSQSITPIFYDDKCSRLLSFPRHFSALFLRARWRMPRTLCIYRVIFFFFLPPRPSRRWTCTNFSFALCVSGIMTLTSSPCELDNMSLFQDLKLKRRKVDSRCSSDGESSSLMFYLIFFFNHYFFVAK